MVTRIIGQAQSSFATWHRNYCLWLKQTFARKDRWKYLTSRQLRLAYNIFYAFDHFCKLPTEKQWMQAPTIPSAFAYIRKKNLRPLTDSLIEETRDAVYFAALMNHSHDQLSKKLQEVLRQPQYNVLLNTPFETGIIVFIQRNVERKCNLSLSAYQIRQLWQPLTSA